MVIRVQRRGIKISLDCPPIYAHNRIVSSLLLDSLNPLALMRRWTTCDIFIASNTSDCNGSAEMAKDVVVKTSIDEKGVQEFTEMFLASGVEPRSIKPRECTLEEFGCHFFAEVEGKIVGRVFLDTLYPPYAELVNLLVHPDYRKKGVGSALVQACIDLAQKRSCSLIHLFAEYDNQIAMKLYSKFGFMPIIDADLRVERGEFVHYMHFSSETRLGDFLRIHPHASQHIYPEKVEFHGRSLFKCEWSDLESGDRTAIFVNAKRGQPMDAFMPRIAGVSHTQGGCSFHCLVTERGETIELGSQAPFDLWLRNSGNPSTFAIDFILPEGVSVQAEDGVSSVRLGENEDVTLSFNLSLAPGFHVPVWTYYTVLATSKVSLMESKGALLLSAGFERKKKS